MLSDARMALLVMIVLLFITWTIADSPSNKTRCDLVLNNSTCSQLFSCVQPPCTMLCGLTSPYDACDQHCDSSKCTALECRASKSCRQLCSSVTCESMTCDAKDCSQSCRSGNCESMTCDAKDCTQSCHSEKCRRMTCSKTVKNCSQVSGSHSEMICEGHVCRQSCYSGCHMSCPVGGTKCTQVSDSLIGGASMECDRGLCVQVCHYGQCNMNCSSNVTAGRCQQTCDERCKSMMCSAMNCRQLLSRGYERDVYGDSNLVCPFGVKSCTQVAYLKNVTLRCQGNVCQQVCFDGDCNLVCLPGVKSCTQAAYEKNTVLHCDGETCQQSCSKNCQMTCSASVKECHQICASSSGKCFLKCDAANCTSQFPTTATTYTTATTTASTIKNRGAPLQMGFSCVGGFMLTLIIYKQLILYM